MVLNWLSHHIELALLLLKGSKAQGTDNICRNRQLKSKAGWCMAPLIFVEMDIGKRDERCSAP
jgi:hypothetical protein